MKETPDERAARIKRQAMRDHPFTQADWDPRYCGHMSGSTKVTTVGTLSFGSACGYPPDCHPKPVGETHHAEGGPAGYGAHKGTREECSGPECGPTGRDARGRFMARRFPDSLPDPCDPIEDCGCTPPCGHGVWKRTR